MECQNCALCAPSEFILAFLKFQEQRGTPVDTTGMRVANKSNMPAGTLLRVCLPDALPDELSVVTPGNKCINPNRFTPLYFE